MQQKYLFQIIIQANAKLDQFAKEITHMYKNVTFSSKQFNQILGEQAVNSVRLLEYYYKLFSRLKILALSLSSILQYVQNLDEALYELINHDEVIAEGNIKV